MIKGLEVVSPLSPPDPREPVWLCSGLWRRYRVCTSTFTYGEWDEEVDARMALALILAGNPDKLCSI